jgi:hypothetical protein
MPALFAGDQQEKDMSYLIGKFVLVDSGESYRTGEIVTTVARDLKRRKACYAGIGSCHGSSSRRYT